MEYEKIEPKLTTVLKLVEKWQKAGVVALIEQNIALNELQQAYKQIMELSSNPIVEAVACNCEISQSALEVDSTIEELEHIIDEKEETVEVQKEVIEEQQDIIEEQKEVIVEQELVVEEQEEVIVEQELVVEEQEEVIVEQELVVEKQENVIEEQPIIEPDQPQITLEILLFGQAITQMQKKNYIFELFWRDEHYYDQEVAKLEAMPDLDSALIYISEKYNWSAGCPFADSFITLLSNKF